MECESFLAERNRNFLFECPRWSVMRAATGFYADAYWGQLREKGHEVMPGQALAKDDLPRVIYPRRVKHALCHIDAEYSHLLLHWTRLLWLNGFPDLELIVAHCSRSAQGRVHFITTKWKDGDYVYRVAWRNIRDGIMAQLALYETEIVDMPQVFFPFATAAKGQTLYEKMVDGKFLLGDGKGE